MDHIIIEETALLDYSQYLFRLEDKIYNDSTLILNVLEKSIWQDKIYNRIVELFNQLINKVNSFTEKIDYNAYLLSEMYEILLRYNHIKWYI